MDFTFSYGKDIPEDDISRTVKNIVEKINLAKYIDFSNRDNGVMMFECIILGKAIKGYASVRDLEELCRFDNCFKLITQVV